MGIKFHDTLSGQLKDFQAGDTGEVSLYTCGPTVYHYAHIGNFRTFVFEDLLRRFLESEGYKVRHVMNITDVDDKTIAGAQREKKSLREYTSFYTDAFLEDRKSLNILPADVMPNATDEIPAMISLIETLMAKGIAYKAEDGSVYYRVAEFPGYGKLSKKKLDGNIAGVRVNQDEYEKEEGADFVLWKAAKENEPSWDSPWGKGRPGWHIECSAMCMRHLGETVDIHAGGEDLVFPHHENEIAQSEAATGKPFARYWLHARHLLVNGEKMSKSKGNFFTLRDLLQKGYDPMAIRYVLMSVHYRQQLNFTLESLKEAREVIEKLDNCYFQCLSRIRIAGQKNGGELNLGASAAEIGKALGDDLNIAKALAIFQKTVSEINVHLAHLSETGLSACVEFFERMDRIFGFDISSVREIPSDVMRTLSEYVEARKVKDFATSDQLRKAIAEKGWQVKDGRPGEPSTVKKNRRVWDGKK